MTAEAPWAARAMELPADERSGLSRRGHGNPERIGEAVAHGWIR